MKKENLQEKTQKKTKKTSGQKYAPNGPGIAATWTSSAKDGVGKSLKATSNVSFTIGEGILNEIYYPWEDEACVRDMGLLVADGNTFFSDERTDTVKTVKTLADGVPAYEIITTCKQKRYRITKEIIADPIRNTVMQKVQFQALKGKLSDYGLYVFLTPHLEHQGAGNTAWVEEYKGVPMLFAERNTRALALVCSMPWLKQSVGYIGSSDGWRDVCKNKKMTREYTHAPDGNVGIIGQIDLEKTKGEFVLALGLGTNHFEAAYSARGSVLAGFEEMKTIYMDEWKTWQKKLSSARSRKQVGKLYRMSAAVLRLHEANRIPGAIIASLSIPWGDIRGDKDPTGYHMVWPRDLAESAGGLLALDTTEDPLRILTYLMTTQEKDGHWVQNMRLSGKTNWSGIQMDQTALPILLLDLFLTQGALKKDKLKRYWVTVKDALSFIIKVGPGTQQDRWERDSGLSIFTVATEIAALVAGAEFADAVGEKEIAKYCREVADCWNDHLEDWFYVKDTEMAAEVGAKGYYIRLNPFDSYAEEAKDEILTVRNHLKEDSQILMKEMVSPDALSLVRFGLRDAEDPRILDTIKVIDKQLKVTTPHGDCWHRYFNDGYGEHEDGSPYDGTGVGRAWPLLTGERAHYEIAAGNLNRARELAKDMENFAHYGLFPEQIWDTEDIPEYGLYFGQHTNGAMPLVWAHSEYIKLCASLVDKKVYDMPLCARKRYVDKKNPSQMDIWREDFPTHTLHKGLQLRIQSTEPMTVQWSKDGWKRQKESKMQDSGLGVYYTDIKPDSKSTSLQFRFYREKENQWIDLTHEVRII